MPEAAANTGYIVSESGRGDYYSQAQQLSNCARFLKQKLSYDDEKARNLSGLCSSAAHYTLSRKARKAECLAQPFVVGTSFFVLFRIVLSIRRVLPT